MDIEAYAVVVELLGQAHAHGEAIASKLELWIGVSSGLIVMAYFAPERMRVSITVLVLSLYIAFSAFVFTNVTEDMQMSRRAVADAEMIASQHNLGSSLLEFRTSEQGSGETLAFAVVAVGLLFGTIGYLIATCVQNWRANRKDAEQ